ncbi:MAG: hypothetical protein FWD40_06480 [Treponema sp.]|nr:hypothetical protein [Treponema sp.]
MKRNILIFLFLMIIFLLASCNDPVFYTVSRELPPLIPRIAGSPTNLVNFDGKMYVASGRNLFNYQNDVWNHMQLPGWIRDISATNNYLYACIEGNPMLKRSADGIAWEDISTEGLNIQSLFGAGNQLFFSVLTGSVYEFYYVQDGSSSAVPIDGTFSLLSGIAFNGTYFLCTSDGIYYTTGGSPIITLVPETSSRNFRGIILLGDNVTVVAITRGGDLFNITVGGAVSLNVSMGGRPSNDKGTLAVYTTKWEGHVPIFMLLAGTQDVLNSFSSSDTHGYLELELSLAGGFEAGSSFRWPGSFPSSSVHDYERYLSSIGKHGVNHILQAADGVLFASTQQKGVWSYRDRSHIGGWQWNAEE